MKNKRLKTVFITVITLILLGSSYVFAREVIQKNTEKKQVGAAVKTNTSQEKKIMVPEFDGKTYDLSGMQKFEALKTDINNDGVYDVIDIYRLYGYNQGLERNMQLKTYMVITNGKDNKVLTSAELTPMLNCDYGFNIDLKDVTNDGIKDILINHTYYEADGSGSSILIYKDKTYVNTKIFAYDDVEYTLLDDFTYQARSKANPNIKCMYKEDEVNREASINGGIYTSSGKLIEQNNSIKLEENGIIETADMKDIDNDGKYEVIQKIAVAINELSGDSSSIKKAYKYQNNEWILVNLSFTDTEDGESNTYD